MRTRLFGRGRFAAAALLLVASLVAPGPRPFGPALAEAQQRSLVIEQLDVELRVQGDGTVRVVERYRIRFDGEWNGLRRFVNTAYADSEQRLQLGDFEATGESGESLRVDVDRRRDEVELRIWVPGANDATREVALSYTALNALRFYDDDGPGGAHDELHWNATGNAWEVPILAASATVVLPDSATDIRTAGFTGEYGSTASDLDISVDGTRIAYRAHDRLDPGEGLTVTAGWAPGAIDRAAASVVPDDAEFVGEDMTPAGAVAVLWPLLLPLLALYLMHRTWRRHGDDPDPPVVVRYEPPASISPAELGFVLDERVASREVTATIVDLAVRGQLAIEETEEDGFLGIGKSKKYAFTLEGNPEMWAQLKPHEREVLHGLFGVGGWRDRVEMDDLEGEFYKTAEKMNEKTRSAILDAGHWREKPTVVRGKWVLGAVVSGAALAVLGLILSDVGVVGSVPVWIAATAAIAVIMAGYGLAMPIRSEPGRALYARVLGFKEFLTRVEADRIERTMLTPEMFDRFLPFAMAIGAEQHWAEKFEDMTLPPPEWYRGASPHARFTATSFVHTLGDATRAAGAAMSPPSSSSSGFGGGGFSGGGGGGGGGGGF
ncbi:MAG: DUF2207 domain-containing protein [Longimicrobiales bacterium]